MAVGAQTVSMPAGPFEWFREFLKEELAPYRGRVALVARMVIAATLVMIVSMTFRLPDGGYAAIYAITISRESPRETFAAVTTMAITFAVAAAYEVIGAMFFADDPALRLVWLLATFFLMFFALSALTNYTAAVRFGYLVVITTPLWDRHVPATVKVEGTLWAVWTITLASLITALVELLFARFARVDELVVPIAERLTAIEDLLLTYSEDRPLDKTVEKAITRFAMVGISQLRRNLYRSSYESQYREQMGAVISLVGRLVDLAAALTPLTGPFPVDDRKRMRSLAEKISNIRIDLERGALPRAAELPDHNDPRRSFPLLREMETTVDLVPEVFAGSLPLGVYAPAASSDSKSSTLFRADALSNFEHIKFGLRGCLAAGLCYVIYNAIDWPGISTAVTTCFLTAQTTIGASRQKQILRVAGALLGGVVIGVGAQVFVLPYVNSIVGFTVFFMIGTTAAAWIATSSARLSYLGVQVALAFYLLELEEFKFQTSLSVTKDRMAGILLGLLVMWLVFDQIWGASAGDEMKRAFTGSLRLLAQFAREPLSGDRRVAVDRSYALRESLNGSFDKVRSFADGVLLEFGASRQRDLLLRDRIRRALPDLRVLFITRIALLKYRLELPGFELPKPVASAQRQFDDDLADSLNAIANRLDGQSAQAGQREPVDGYRRLEAAVEFEIERAKEASFARLAQLRTFLVLSHRTSALMASLEREI